MTRAVQAFAAADNRMDREKVSAAERERRRFLGETMRSTVLAAQGDGTIPQRVERLQTLGEAVKDALVALQGPDDAHPFLAGLSKDTGYRLSTPTARAAAHDRAERAFSKEPSQ